MERRPHDVGRTMGGGSLGHRAPEDPAQPAPIRNNADDEGPTDGRETPDQDKDPVMPSRDSTLNTRI